MAYSLADKWVLITGGSSGFGAAAALAFAAQGAHVLLGARRVDRLEAVAAQARQTGAGSAHAHVLDVAKTESVEAYARWVRGLTDRVDVLINNAGGALGLDTVAEGKDEDWEGMFQSNVLGLLRVTRAILPLLPHNAGASILNLGSIAGRVAYEGGRVADLARAAAGALRDGHPRDVDRSRSRGDRFLAGPLQGRCRARGQSLRRHRRVDRRGHRRDARLVRFASAACLHRRDADQVYRPGGDPQSEPASGAMSSGEEAPAYSEAEFLDKLRAVGTAAYHDRHPFHVAMNEGLLGEEAIRGWVANRFCYQQAIPRKDAAILANCPDREVRRSWIHRIVEHDGTGGDEGGIEAWVRLGEACGVSRAELLDERHVLPAVRFAVEAYVTFARREPWPIAVASSLTELFAPDLMARRLGAFERHYEWVPAWGFDYFRRRLTQAPRDSQEALALTLQHCRSRERQEAALRALAFKCDVLWALLDAIQQRYGVGEGK
jgi:pyrroloquinoline-quinone synthase